MAKEIMGNIIDRKSNTKKDSNKSDIVKIPDLIGKTVVEAKEELDKIGLESFIESDIGDYHLVSDQYPSKGNMIENSSTIELKSDGDIRVPNLINMDIDDALKLLESNNIEYELKNKNKYIKSQSLDSGEILNKGSKLVITSKEKK